MKLTIYSYHKNILTLLALVGSFFLRSIYIDEAIFGAIFGAITLYLFQQIQNYGFRGTFWPRKDMEQIIVSYHYCIKFCEETL
jgi:multisubunit Na+/H+ antiporter MnhE subunit